MSEIDMHKILLEIDEEVRAKRASGELPADLERELDLVFARFAPAGAVDGDFDQLLARAEQQSFVDLLAPNESVRPGVPHVKRVVQKAVRWYVRYVVEQFSGFAHTITKAVRRLSERVESIEQLSVGKSEVDALPVPLLDVAWHARIVDSLRNAKGRVCHARCGTDGALVAKLREAAVDAYGVDPHAESTDLDLRPDDERTHLRTLTPGALSGLVLSGSVDTLPPGAQVELIDLAAVAVDAGGVVVIAASSPEAWQRTQGTVLTDLSPGRPLHAETWRHLLSDRGFVVESIEQSAAAGGLFHVPGTDETAAGVNANIDKLNELLYPPSSCLIIARRSPAHV